MKNSITLLIIAALILSLTGCGAGPSTEPLTPAPETAPDQTVEPASEPTRQDGERFEAVIFLEGMEEPVQYEHVRNDTLGFEMDYDYESFTRYTDTDCERFISTWDDPANPLNYLEVRSDTENAELAADAISAALSNEYEVIRDAHRLEQAGSCIRLEAYVSKGTGRIADQLQVIYIIPAPDGCRIATEHYSAEAAEGFGRRFDYMMQTLTAID